MVMKGPNYGVAGEPANECPRNICNFFEFNGLQPIVGNDNCSTFAVPKKWGKRCKTIP
jgi:hypothetical protein